MIGKTLVIAAAGLCSLSAADLSFHRRVGLRRHVEIKSREVEFVQRGTDGLTVKIANLHAICAAKFDGKDYPAAGPTIPPRYTLAIRRIDRCIFTASEDGSTLTENDSANAIYEKANAIYERE
jgi:hypothetical protein